MGGSRSVPAAPAANAKSAAPTVSAPTIAFEFPPKSCKFSVAPAPKRFFQVVFGLGWLTVFLNHGGLWRSSVWAPPGLSLAMSSLPVEPGGGNSFLPLLEGAFRRLAPMSWGGRRERPCLARSLVLYVLIAVWFGIGLLSGEWGRRKPNFAVFSQLPSFSRCSRKCAANSRLWEASVH
ncbi:hypothetical protein TRVL_09636 [Trypanosoma vivax]|uniref:Uncharacterized protein n=1 Tax=Trypanosoma vivax (strain Y486) TaxID=1055687 RepID=G0TT13_TRYVY|nr:hypothetical protein TRVL_09636 [Trypanosoma vivax]CCC47094.1 hypothetical protein TVY486_0302810 [Trypanosoma vivax Y486]